MEENHQGKTEIKRAAIEDKKMLPEDGKKHDRLQKDHKKARQALFMIGAGLVGAMVFGFVGSGTGLVLFLVLIGILLLGLHITSKLTATEDTKWFFKGKSKLRVPKHSKSSWLRRGFKYKSSWDWLQLLIQIIGAIAVPLSIFVGLYTFTTQQKEDNLRTQQQNINSAKLADAQQQETTLQTYLNDMTTLLFDDKLGGKAPTSAEAAVIARSKTIITLSRLPDPQRKATVVNFLYESHLIGYYDFTNMSLQPPIIDLSSADLSDADLSDAFLSGATLSGATLSNATLSNATLSYANLSGATLSGANLRGAELSGAKLNNTDLSNATLSNATLSGAFLSGAFLSGAIDLSQQQLDQVYSCKNATLPAGLTCHNNAPVSDYNNALNNLQSQIPNDLATPAKTLNSYCIAFKSGDFHTAYVLTSSSVQSQVTESQFTTIEQQSVAPQGNVSDCVVSNVNQNGSAATGTITYTFGDGKSRPVNYTLVNENGGWKINEEG